MSPSKKTAPGRPTGKRKTPSTTTERKKTAGDKKTAQSRKRPSTATPATKRAAAASGAARDHDANRTAPDPSDLARDERLRHDLEDEGGRSIGDRHRQRLTAIESEEDGVAAVDDEDEDGEGQREQALSEQDDAPEGRP